MLKPDGVSPCCTSALAVQGLAWGKLCLSPRCRIPKAGLAASIRLEIPLTALSGLQQREVCSLLRGVHEEIVDVAFSIGAKAHNIFLVVHYLISQREALHMCCRALAWLAIASVGA